MRHVASSKLRCCRATLRRIADDCDRVRLRRRITAIAVTVRRTVAHPPARLHVDLWAKHACRKLHARKKIVGHMSNSLMHTRSRTALMGEEGRARARLGVCVCAHGRAGGGGGGGGRGTSQQVVKCALHIRRLQCRHLHEADAIGLGKGPAFFRRHGARVVEVSFVADLLGTATLVGSPTWAEQRGRIRTVSYHHDENGSIGIGPQLSYPALKTQKRTP